MGPKPVQGVQRNDRGMIQSTSALKTLTVCISGALVPGLGHALLGKWDRAAAFFCCISAMLILGIHLDGRLCGPEFSNFFSLLKFVANAGSGLLYWIPWLNGLGPGDPTAYTYYYANVYIYVAGLLNMLVVVDVFDIALGRKR
jgi:hypothetical protein